MLILSPIIIGMCQLRIGFVNKTQCSCNTFNNELTLAHQFKLGASSSHVQVEKLPTLATNAFLCQDDLLVSSHLNYENELSASKTLPDIMATFSSLKFRIQGLDVS